MAGDIALDIEGVLADVHFRFVEEVNDRYEDELQENGLYPLRFQDIDDWRSWGDKIQQLGLSGKDCLDLKKEMWKRQYRRIPSLIDDFGVRDRFAELADEYDVDVVTALDATDEAAEWLQRHGLEKGVHFNEFVFDPDEAKTELGYTLLLEDNPEVADDLDDDQGLILYDQPYNRGVEESDEPYIRRVQDLDEMVDEAYRFFEEVRA